MLCLKETNKGPKASTADTEAACKTTSFISLKNRFTFKLNNPIYESVGTNL